jgi:hypothetical protein
MSRWIETTQQDERPNFTAVDAAVTKALESRKVILPSFSLNVGDLVASSNGFASLTTGTHPLAAVLRDEKRLLVEHILKRIYGGNARGLYECINDKDRGATPYKYIRVVGERLAQSYQALGVSAEALIVKFPHKDIERMASEFVRENYPEYVGQVTQLRK